jgi:lysyl-tRNA synthetase class 2
MFKKLLNKARYGSHGFSFKISSTIQQFKNKYNGISEEVPHIEQLAGRVYGIRKLGKNLTFVDIGSNGENVQLVFKDSGLVSSIKRGDILGLSGNPFRTKTAELSLKVEKCEILSKCFNENIPISRDDKDMLTDPETRYSKRYLDLIVNNNHKNIFLMRSKIIKFLRNYLESDGFLEVETPILSHKAGGALANPFITKSNALKTDLHLRIAPELYLKQLIISGFEKVFEIGKNFRNEDISIKHNPEFTSCEFYKAYADYLDLIEMTKDFIKKMAIEVTGDTRLIYNDKIIDLNEFQVLDVNTEIEKYFNTKLSLDKTEYHSQIDKLYKDLNIHIPAANTKKKLDRLIEHIIEPKSENKPLFIINHPVLLSPLAKNKPDNPLLTERFEFFINKMELINAYSELTDPIEQRKRFEEQHNDDEVHPMDNEFIEALMLGMPPTAGWGVGIDRLCMIFMNQMNIKEVILFPQMNVK